MNAPLLAALPDLHAVPGPFWLLTALHLLTFVLHLAAMASLVGGVAVVLASRAEDRWSRPAVRRLLGLFPVLMAATVSLGIAPLLFLQLSYGRVAYAAAITSAAFWFLVPFLAMAAYACFYAASRRPSGDARAGRTLMLGFGFLMAVALVYSSTFSLAEHPDAYARLYASSASGVRLNPDVLTVIPRLIQAVAGAVALGAFVTRLVVRDDEGLRATAARVLMVGAVVAAAAAGLRLAVDGALRAALDGVGTTAFAAGVVLPLLAAATLRRERARTTGALLVAGLVASVVARHLARLATLKGAFDPASPAVRPQWDVFALFVVCLVVALATIAWMLRVWFTGSRPQAG